MAILQGVYGDSVRKGREAFVVIMFFAHEIPKRSVTALAAENVQMWVEQRNRVRQYYLPTLAQAGKQGVITSPEFCIFFYGTGKPLGFLSPSVGRWVVVLAGIARWVPASTRFLTSVRWWSQFTELDNFSQDPCPHSPPTPR